MQRRLLAASLAALALLPASCAHAGQKVVGYSTSWSGDAAAVPIARVTHINYAFVVPFPDGTVEPMPSPGKLTLLVSTAHAAGKKVLISVGGWNDGNDSGFEILARSASTRLNFVNNMLAVVNVYGLDGVDIDWEFPDQGSSGEDTAADDTSLLAAIWSVLGPATVDPPVPAGYVARVTR